jgi:hypothetical protein
VAAEPVAEVLAAYRSAIARTNEIISFRSLDEAPEQPEPWWPDAGLDFPDLRTIMVHMGVDVRPGVVIFRLTCSSTATGAKDGICSASIRALRLR